MHLNEKAAKLLLKNQLTLSLAESCTGGLVSHQLTEIPGASAFFLYSVIAYENKAKTSLLKVPSSLIKKNGAVSEPVALKMAQGVKKILKTNIGLALTGIAGPSGGSWDKPVGTVFIALSSGKENHCERYQFKGTRSTIKNQASEAALKMLINFLVK